MRDEQKTKAELLRELKTLRESEEKWRSVVENAPSIIVIVDLDGTVSYINHTVSGIAPEKVVGTSVYDYILAEHHGTLEKSLKRVFQKEETDSLELVGIGRDNTTSWYEAWVGPVKRHGRVVAATFVAEDITERKRAENTLRESEEQLHLFMDSATEGFTLWDSQFNLVRANKAVLSMFPSGTKEEDLIGKNALEIVPNLKQSGRYEKYMEVMKTGKPLFFDGLVPRAEFGDRLIDVRAFRVGDGLGLIITDVTERKRTLERDEAILKTCIDGFWLLDTGGQILEVNDAYCRMSGYGRDELLKMNLQDVEASETPQEVAEHIQQVMNVGAHRFESRHRRKDGTIMYLDISAHCLPLYGGRVFTFFRDITERKQVEDALRESEEKYRTLSANIPGMVFRAKPDWSVEFISDSESICGYSPQEFYLQQVNWLDIVHPEDKQRVHRGGTELAQKSASFVQEYRIITRNGDVRWVEDHSMSSFTEEGVLVGIDGVVFDITERKKAEDALRESEQKYRGLSESLDELVYRADPKGFAATYVNSAVERFYGYSVEEWLGAPDLWKALIHPDDKERVLRELREAQRKLISTVVEYRIINKRKEMRWVEDHVSWERDPEGKLLSVNGVVYDITERKRVEDALRRASVAVGTSLNAVFSADLEGKVIYANPVAASMWGFEDPAEMVGTDVLDYWAEEHRQEAMRAVETLIKEGSYLNLEGLVARRQNGTVFLTEVKSSVVKDESGNPVGMVGSFIDITDRRKAEEAVRGSEEKYRTLVESAGDSIATVDENGVLLFVNNWAAQDLGGEPEDFVGKTMWDLFPKEIADRQAANVRKVIDTKQGMNLILPTEVQGQPRWFSTTIEPLRDSSGTVAAAMVIARDITEFKKAEEELERYREEMARAEQLASLGTLSATVAHELTQPLTIIRLSLDNALDELEATSPPETVTRRLKDSVAEVSNLTSIVERFRNFARQSSRKTVGEVDLKAVAERIVQFLSESARRAGIALRLKDMDRLPLVYANERDLEQLFFALVENAIQAANGKEARELVISGAVEDEYIEVRFSDDCGGIAPENLDEIFKPFFTTKPPGQGTGLGLCIVQDVVSRAGGKVRVESEFGKGSTFFVALPVNEGSIS